MEYGSSFRHENNEQQDKKPNHLRYFPIWSVRFLGRSVAVNVFHIMTIKRWSPCLLYRRHVFSVCSYRKQA